MLSARAIVELQDQRTRAWHHARETETRGEEKWLELVERQHRANFELWHIEDEARMPGASCEQIADVKRRVDVTNQRRNDLAEELDRVLLAWLEGNELPHAGTPLHSESPGLIIDRLSILALKIYHTREEAERTEAPEGHAERNHVRLAVVEEQRADLAECLDALWRETVVGTRRFKLYRQMKMYNDPDLNPAIYNPSSRNPEIQSPTPEIPGPAMYRQPSKD